MMSADSKPAALGTNFLGQELGFVNSGSDGNVGIGNVRMD
jgi:hypothetical protein